ncbi:hypothetical protein G3A43_44075 [Paraburkholderia aspalathi]|uniref:hypothetical protein n=1 Tax=Paraburkholderia nemoris TaxID=2793076 RepID=UPI00190CB9D1|nr:MULTISPECIES: hypothetical protein [Paraburkholderia]MBK3787137.1 hypothetical protein [Paraburkholderia aspalathi]
MKGLKNKAIANPAAPLTPIRRFAFGHAGAIRSYARFARRCYPTLATVPVIDLPELSGAAPRRITHALHRAIRLSPPLYQTRNYPAVNQMSFPDGCYQKMALRILLSMARSAHHDRSQPTTGITLGKTVPVVGFHRNIAEQLVHDAVEFVIGRVVSGTCSSCSSVGSRFA